MLRLFSPADQPALETFLSQRHYASANLKAHKIDLVD